MLGQLLAFRRDPIVFLTRIAREYPGDVVRFRPGPRDSYLVKHPELIKDVLVTRQHDFSKSRGLEWAKLFLARGCSPAKGTSTRASAGSRSPPSIASASAATRTTWCRRTTAARDRWSAGQVLDVDGEMMRLTLAIASSTLFGTDVAASADEVREDLTAIIALFPRFSLPLFGLIQKLPLPSNARFNRALARLDTLVYRIIAERQRDPADRGDLLSMLLLARDEESGGG
jgi:cytochrome P450